LSDPVVPMNRPHGWNANRDTRSVCPSSDPSGVELEEERNPSSNVSSRKSVKDQRNLCSDQSLIVWSDEQEARLSAVGSWLMHESGWKAMAPTRSACPFPIMSRGANVARRKAKRHAGEETLHVFGRGTFQYIFQLTRRNTP